MDENVPAYKTPQVNAMLASAGMNREEAITSLKCLNEPLGCAREIPEEELKEWEPIQRQEYKISGWCNTCQVRVFGGLAEDEDYY